MLRIYVRDEAGVWNEYTDVLRPDKVFEIGGRMFDGQADQGNVTLDDPDATLDWVTEFGGHRKVKITEDASGSELVIAAGRLGPKDLERGTFVAYRGREFKPRIEDQNADLRGIIVDRWHRPEETGRARVLALLAAYLNGSSSTAVIPGALSHAGDIWGRLSTVIEDTYVQNASNVTMSAATYEATDPLAIIRECAEIEGKRFGVYLEDDGTYALYYAPVTEEDQLNCTISVSDNKDDVDGVTCFEPWWNAGPALSTDPLETLSGALLVHADGERSFERRDAPNIITGALDIEERHDRWEEAIRTDQPSGGGTAQVDTLLDFRDQEDRHRQFSILMPGELIHLVKAGMRIEVKRAFASAIGSSSFFRISNVRYRYYSPMEGGESLFLVIVTLEYPIKLLRKGRGSSDSAPACPVPEPGTEAYRWSFDADNLDDATSTYDCGFKWSSSTTGSLNPGFGSTYGYPTATSGPCDLIPITALQNYTFNARVIFKVNRTLSFCDIQWYNSGSLLATDRWFDGNDYSDSTIFDVGSVFTAPATANGFRFRGPTVGLCYAIDDIVVGETEESPGGDPFCLPDPGSSPHDAKSDDPRFDNDDQHAITRLVTRSPNNSGGALVPGNLVVMDLTEEGSVTTTSVEAYTAGMVGVVLEGGADGATVLVLWMGRAGFVNIDTAVVGDTITTSTTPTEGLSVSGRVEGSVGRVLGVDDEDRPTIVEWWGIPDTATGPGTGSFVLNYGGGEEVLQAHGNLGSTETIDLANGNYHTGTLNANCTFTFTAVTNGVACSFRLRLQQDGTGSRTATWPGSVVWPGGVAPTLSTAASSVDLLSFETTDGGTTWYGSYDRTGAGGGASLPWYVVTDAPYNAVGDDTNDDTAEIQAAIDAAEAAGGGIVYFPKGTYKITSALTVQAQIILRGEGKWASIIRQATANTSGFSCNNSADLATFEHLQVLGPTGGSSGTAILTTKALNLYSVRTEGFFNGLQLGAGSFYSKVYESFFYDADQSGVYLTAGSNNSAFFGCYAAGCGDSNVYVGGNEQFAWYGGSNEAAGTYGFLIDSAAGSGAGSGNETGGWIISGTYFENASATDIRIGSTAEDVFAGTVQGCKFTASATWHIDGGYVNGLNIQGNYLLGGKAKVRVNATNGSNVLLGNNYATGSWGTMPASTVSIEAGDTRTPVAIGGANAAGSGPALSFFDHVHSEATAAGTSFPGSPATSARFFRTDRNLEYIYDGTRWVTTILFRETPTNQMGAFPITATNVVAAMPLWHTAYDIYVEAMYYSIYVATTNDGSKFWTVDLNKRNAADTATSLGSFNTSAFTVNNNVTGALAVGAVVTQPTNKVLGVTVTKTSTPGGIYPNFSIAYRLVG